MTKAPIASKLALGLALGLACAAPAFAHVTLERREAAAGEAYRGVLVVPHGCGREATTAIRVQIPEGLYGVKPMAKPGWTITTTVKPYAKPYTLHGKPVAEGVAEIVWSGGQLPDDQVDEFVFVGRVDPAAAPGSVLYAPVVQTCASGEARWVEVPAAERPGERLASPAPAIRIAQGGHGAEAPAAVIERNGLRIEGAWSRATPGGARVAGGYLKITNTGAATDRLIGGEAPFAERVEIHEMATSGGVMTMRPLPTGLAIEPGRTVELRPGGYHAMFMGLRQPLVAGQTVKATLTFERAGRVEVEFRVGAIGGQSAPQSAPSGEHRH